jgi:hypothetical protein
MLLDLWPLLDETAPTFDFGPYLQEPGGQTIVLADGDYEVADFVQPASQRTDWLVLRASTPHGVRVVPRGGGDLVVEHVGEWTYLNKIAFVGIDFVDLRLNLHGCDEVVWWYPAWAYPNSAYPGAGPGTHPADQAPTTVLFTAGGSPFRRSNRCAIYGGNLTASVDCIDWKKADEIAAVGCILTPSGSPYEEWHDDATQLSGQNLGVDVFCSWVKGRNFWKIEPEFNTLDCDIAVRESWVSGSFGVGFHLGVKEDAANPAPTAKLAVTRTNVRSWGHNGADTLEGDNNTHPELVQLNDFNYIPDVAPSGDDPATKWRAAHPYTIWSDYLGIPIFVYGESKATPWNVGLLPAPLANSTGGTITYSGSNLLIENLKFLRRVIVTGQDITFKNCWFAGEANPATGNELTLVWVRNTAANVLLEHCLFKPQTPNSEWGDGLFGHNFTVRRSRFMHTIDGIGVNHFTNGQTASAVIEGNLISDLAFWSPYPSQPDNRSHNDCIQLHNAIDGVTIRGNTLRASLSPHVGNWAPGEWGTASILNGSNSVGDVWLNTLIEKNWISGGITGCNFGAKDSATNLDIVGNRWGRDFRNGPATYVQKHNNFHFTGTNSISGNVYEDDGTPANQGACCGSWP